ncbi:MAG: 40S ribosomal protein S16 [Watsoniomyces obsoletus]|nr:MAG: 40S ribosomal protein S16 [Watsoniomyces obsoletus]
MSEPGGRLYVFGSNSSCQLGLSHREDVSVPTLCPVRDILSYEVPSKIVAGGNHTLLSFRTGRIDAAGENHDGRTCFSAVPSHHGLTRVYIRTSLSSNSGPGLMNRFLDCSATWEASIFVDPGQRVYSVGTGLKGELGLGEDVTSVKTPTQMKDFPPLNLEIVHLASSMSHTVAVLSDGDVYGWGHARNGQLGDQAGMGTVWSPRRIAVPFPAVRVCCGREFTFIVGDQDEGECIVLGSDKWNVRSDAPSHIPDWKDIGATWGGIYVLFRDGSVRSWGRNDHGQLAPEGLPPLRMMATGSEHVLAVTQDQKLITWGWGEHGNCGPDTDEDGDVKGRWSEIKIEEESSMTPTAPVTAIGAGCATSFVWCT